MTPLAPMVVWLLQNVMLPLVFALTSGAIGYWISHKMGRKSGSFKKKEFDLLLYDNYSLLHKPLDYVVFGYSPEISPDDIALCYLPIKIHPLRGWY